MKVGEIFTHLHFDHVGWATAKGEPGWEFVFDVDRAAARAVREQITAELLDSQDPAAAAHFPGGQFGRLVRAEKTGREWIFLEPAQ